MARTELIKELKIRKKEIHSEIKIQLPNLIEELTAIDKIIDSSIGVEAKASTTATNLIDNKHNNGTPRGDMIWIDYVQFMLKEIGGKGKSRDVASAIHKANNDLTLKRAISVSYDKLSKLKKDGKIKSTADATSKNGFIYEIF